MVLLERLEEVDWIEEFMTAQRPLVAAYWNALQQRPSYRSAIAGHVHPLVAKGRQRIVALKQSDPAFNRALLGGG